MHDGPPASLTGLEYRFQNVHDVHDVHSRAITVSRKGCDRVAQRTRKTATFSPRDRPSTHTPRTTYKNTSPARIRVGRGYRLE
jgi:hypothetical protein